jgi:hypothetical protein
MLENHICHDNALSSFVVDAQRNHKSSQDTEERKSHALEPEDQQQLLEDQQLEMLVH